MRQGYITILVVLLLAGSSLPQTIFEAYHKVERKLSADKKYLNVYAVGFQPKSEDVTTLSNIPRAESGGKFTFRIKDNVTYQFIILKENYELDSTVILAVKEIEDKAASGETFFGETTGASIDTAVVLSFGDIQDLYFSGSTYYAELYSVMMERLKIEDPASMLGITGTEKMNKSRGITSSDNIDFLNFQRVNSIHHYPKIPSDKKASARRRGGDASVNESDYQFDVDFSHVSFFHKSMDFGFSSVSAEINTEAKGLNVVPYKPMALTLGLRMFMNIASLTPDLKKDFILDAKVLGRFRTNLYNTVDKMPFLSGEKPLLNVGSGLILDVTGSRVYGLPVFNLYYAGGKRNVSNPYSSIGPADSSTAYFSFNQWEASFSFYWNASEERFLRMRMDIGVGCYDVVKAVYHNNTAAKELVYNKIKPSITFYINFAPQNMDFMGSSFRLYDNALTASIWMKIVEFTPTSSLRFEASYITAPILRSQYPWEADGGNSIIQFRYRYGLN
jgi:hypothetical protein